jgi:hypothetical protein
MLDSMDTSSFLLAIERFLAVRPRPSVFIADNGSNFRGGDSALHLDKGKQIDLGQAQTHFNIEFKFAPPRAPHFMGLVKGFVGAAKAAIYLSIHSHTLTDKELQTIFARAMGHLNNIPITYTMKSDVDFQYIPLTPSHFLMGGAYNKLQPSDCDVAFLSKAVRYNRVCKILDLFWKQLIAELSTHLRAYNTWVSTTRGIKIGDVALLLDPAKRGTTPLVRVTSAPKDIDGHIRRIVVWDGFKYLAQAITSLAVLVPAEEDE